MVTSLHDAREAVHVRAEVPADGLTFTASRGGFDAGVTILARTRDARGRVLQGATETLELSGRTGQLANARARTLVFERTLPVKGACTVEIAAYDVLGGRATVGRHEVQHP